MKMALNLIGLMMAVSLPLLAQADLRDDMMDPELTLIEIVDNELDKDRAIDAIVEDMIDVEPDQSTAIVAAAIQADPENLDLILSTAINSGANSWEIAGAAILAAEAEEKLRSVQFIVETAVALDPDSTVAIVESAARASVFDYNTIAGIEEKKSRERERPRGYGSVARMEEVPGPFHVETVDPGATLGKSLTRRKTLQSLRTPR